MTNVWSTSREPLKAKDHCCEEAAIQSATIYIPCNAPAVNIVGWKGRSDAPIRMCEFCSDHNVRNRGAYIVGSYTQAWPTQSWVNPTPTDPRDGMNQDALLMLWQDKKAAIEKAKEEEMDLRKYIVKREFPIANEGMNNKELGNGYTLKAGVKFNYNLKDNDTVENCLGKIAAIGNNGAFIADRLVSWTPNFLLSEYRILQEEAEKGEKPAQDILKVVNEMLEIKDAKGKKK